MLPFSFCKRPFVTNHPASSNKPFARFKLLRNPFFSIFNGGLEVTPRTFGLNCILESLTSFANKLVSDSEGKPGNELFNRYSSISADQKASRNYAGVKDPLVDLLIGRVVKAESRKELVTASRLLDRVLLNEYYVIPHWHNTVHRVSYDSRLARPKILPLYYGSEIWAFSTWWWRRAQP